MKPKLLLNLLLFISYCLNAQTKEVYFLSQPCLTPDGQTVIFSFEGDLWKANVKDGNATRLTGMQGYVTNARVSPDGKWIAFSGTQYGNSDVYVMPFEGGDIKQLTYYSGSDNVSSWSWDSKYIYFTSGRMGQLSSYKVSINGGTAQRVFGDYFFLYDHNVFESPATGELFFNDTWESSNQVQRKRYKGPFNPDIQSYNPKTKKYTRYTDWQGKDFGATLDKSGNIYFISDEANDQYNLYTFESNKKTPLTNFSSSIKNVQVNANGGKVVFEKDYQLWLYDVITRKAERLHISILRNNVLPKETDFNVKGKISSFDLSPDGKKMAFVSRGELFVSDADGKFIKEIQRGSSERVSEADWLSDNKTLLFNQTVDGFQNWFTVAADSTAPIKQLTSDKANDRGLVLNKKHTMGVYLSGRNEVRLIDLKTMESKTIVKDSTKKKDTAVASIKIDTDKIMDRIEQIGPTFGSQNLVAVLQKGEKIFVLFTSDHAEGKSALYKTTLEPFENPKTEKINGADADNASIIESGDKDYVLFGGAIYKLNLDANKVDPIVTDYTFRRNLSGEFSQMFYEAWAQLEENYYDEKFHGLDWNKTKTYYRRFLPYLNNRNDLRLLLNDMLGELNSSHQGFFSFGDDEKIPLSNVTMETGIMFDNNDSYKVKYILTRSAADNKDDDVQA